MQYDNLSNFTQKIINFFNDKAIKIGRETKFIQRNPKLHASAFIRALLASCLSQHFTLEIFCSFLLDQGIKITKQGLHQRFNSCCEAYLKELALHFIHQFKHENLSEMPYLNGFSAINIVDSSTVSLPSLLSETFKGSGGAASNAALKIQLMYDYLAGQVKALTLTSGCDADQGFDVYFQKIQKQALYLMDLGYFKLASFKKIKEGGAFFVSRLLTGTKLFTLEGEVINLIELLAGSGNISSHHVLIGAKDKINVRLVAYRLPNTLAEQRRRKLNEDHRRRGTRPSKESLALQDWSVYITNTTDTQIRQADIHHVYSMRWQIELVFKLSKSLLQIDAVRSTKSSRVVVEIYGKFICMMLLFSLCAPVRHKDNTEVSLYKACHLLLTKINDFIHSFCSVYRLKRFVVSFYESIQLFALKDRKTKSTTIMGEGF